MKRTKLFILLISFLTIVSISCSQKRYTMRKLSDVNNAEAIIKKNPNHKATIEKLLDAVEHGNNSVRAEALWVLGESRVAEGYEFFLKYANDDPDFNVRIMAIRGIMKMELNNDASIEKIRIAINDTSLPVQIEALKVAGVLKDERLLQTILNSLSSKNRWVRMASIKSLKDYDDEKVNKVLSRLKSIDRDKSIADTAEQVMEYRKSIGLA